jgi:hypothetical protein
MVILEFVYSSMQLMTSALGNEHVYSWGMGQTSAKLVDFLEGKQVTQLDCGEYEALALTSTKFNFSYADPHFFRIGGRLKMELGGTIRFYRFTIQKYYLCHLWT